MIAARNKQVQTLQTKGVKEHLQTRLNEVVDVLNNAGKLQSPSDFDSYNIVRNAPHWTAQQIKEMGFKTPSIKAWKKHVDAVLQNCFSGSSFNIDISLSTGCPCCSQQATGNKIQISSVGKFILGTTVCIISPTATVSSKLFLNRDEATYCQLHLGGDIPIGMYMYPKESNPRDIDIVELNNFSMLSEIIAIGDIKNEIQIDILPAHEDDGFEKSPYLFTCFDKDKGFVYTQYIPTLANPTVCFSQDLLLKPVDESVWQAPKSPHKFRHGFTVINDHMEETQC